MAGGAAFSRRSFRWLPVQIMAARLPDAVQTESESIDYYDGRVHWSSGSAVAAVGRAGVKLDKHEGDGATPSGTFPLVSVYYRANRIAPPGSKLPIFPLRRADGWVDDPGDANYNRLVSLPYPASAEPMWRHDGLYDLLVVTGYNTAPVSPAAGSAIFLHIATPDFAPTAGCIAVEKEVLLRLVPLLGPQSMITIRT
jgi:L,D-peptidoglycan transpeptidase YkuD (ErfK/YbiS/YcfS/YnhG family)